MIAPNSRKPSHEPWSASRAERSLLGRLVSLLLLGIAGLSVRGAETSANTNGEPIRFAFSSRMFTEVNENDAKASVKAWGLALARERHVPMSTEAIILSDTPALQKAMRESLIDGAAVTAEEYLSLERELQGTNLFASFIGGQYTEEYLLLVRGNSGIADLQGLRGRKLALFDNARASLAPLWLDLILSGQGLGAPADFFGPIVKAQKLTKVVVPVFFGQADACVVTRRGFETMCELNPQIRTQLRVLASSPKLVPALGFIRRGYDSPLRDTLFAALRGLETSAAGAQVLTLFQSDQLHEVPVSLLEETRAFVATHHALSQVTAGRSSPPGLSPQSPATPPGPESP